MKLNLTTAQQKVLCLRFGLQGISQIRSLREVAKIFHVTPERIRQIENEAIRTFVNIYNNCHKTKNLIYPQKNGRY